MSIILPAKCLRNRIDCEPLSQVKSDNGNSFICCGYNDPSSRKIEQDKFRHCWKNSVIDECTDWDRRDIISTIAILSQALHVDSNLEIQ